LRFINIINFGLVSLRFIHILIKNQLHLVDLRTDEVPEQKEIQWNASILSDSKY
jgi:hypothetical protein